MNVVKRVITQTAIDIELTERESHVLAGVLGVTNYEKVRNELYERNLVSPAPTCEEIKNLLNTLYPKIKQYSKL